MAHTSVSVLEVKLQSEDGHMLLTTKARHGSTAVCVLALFLVPTGATRGQLPHRQRKGKSKFPTVQETQVEKDTACLEKQERQRWESTEWEAQAIRVAVVTVMKSRKQAYHMHEDCFPVWIIIAWWAWWWVRQPKWEPETITSEQSCQKPNTSSSIEVNTAYSQRAHAGGHTSLVASDAVRLLYNQISF